MKAREVVRFVNVTGRVAQVVARRLRATVQAVGGCVELVPYVDAHYREWLKALQRRERVGWQRLQLWRYERPRAVPVGNMHDLVARVN